MRQVSGSQNQGKGIEESQFGLERMAPFLSTLSYLLDDRTWKNGNFVITINEYFRIV